MKKRLITIGLVMLMLFPIKALATEKENTPTYVKQNFEEVLTMEGIEHDLSNYHENDDQIPIYLFFGDGCGYCKRFLTFLNSIVDEYGNYFRVEAYEVWKNSNNNKLMNEVATFMNKKATGVPYIVIGKEVFAGYNSNSDNDIKKAIKGTYESKKRYDVLYEMENPSKSNDTLYVVLIFGVVVVGLGGLVYLSRKK